MARRIINSPGHWPIGVLDNELYWLIVPPIVPHWAQDPGELTFPMMVVPRFSIFWPLEKMVKNRPFNFHVFLSFFVIFVEFSTNYEPFWVNSGTSWDLFFDVFFDHLFCLVFCVFFSQISKKVKKQKVLKTLRLCIDLGHRHVEKIVRGFGRMHRFVNQKIIKNRWKIKPKSETNAVREKNR